MNDSPFGSFGMSLEYIVAEISEYLILGLVLVVFVLSIKIWKINRDLEDLSLSNDFMNNKIKELEGRFQNYQISDEKEYDEEEDEEKLEEEVKILEKIKMLCELTRTHINYIVNPDDWDKETVEYEHNKFNERIDKMKELIKGIDDDFLKGAAIQFMIPLHIETNDIDNAKKLLSDIPDEYIKEMVIKEFPVLSV